jgi:hypothetical protein
VSVLAQLPLPLEGALITVAAFVLFLGSVWLLAAAILGVQMGYLVTATGFFGFMIILSALWAFGAPQTPAYLGPQGTLPHWVSVAQGQEVRSPTFPEVEEYPGGPWEDPGDDARWAAEVEGATESFQGFLAERANEDLRAAGVEGEVEPQDFQVRELRFTEAEDGTLLAAARAFSVTGGPEVMVFGYKDLGNEPVPSFLFLAGSIIGFAVHLPFLDRAERRRREVLTGGDQTPWRGPA